MRRSGHPAALLLVAVAAAAVLVLGIGVLAADSPIEAPISGSPTVEPDANVELAQTLCETTGMEAASHYGTIDGLRAVFSSDAVGIATWVEERFGPTGPAPESASNPWRSMAPSTAVAVCVYDGSGFTAPRIPGVEPYDMLVLLVPEDGDIVVDRFGHRDSDLSVTGNQ